LIRPRARARPRACARKTTKQPPIRVFVCELGSVRPIARVPPLQGKRAIRTDELRSEPLRPPDELSGCSESQPPRAFNLDRRSHTVSVQPKVDARTNSGARSSQ